MTHLPSRLCLSDIRHSVPCKNRASTILAALPRCAASYPLPVRQASALPSASSRFAVTHDTLAVRLTLPLAGRVEDFHLKAGAPCRAHHKKRAGIAPRPALPGDEPTAQFCAGVFSEKYSWLSAFCTALAGLLRARLLAEDWP